MSRQLPDMIRDVPEAAVRIFLEAKVTPDLRDGTYLIELDGERFRVPPEVHRIAEPIATALKIKPRRVEYACDILRLRHDAEDMFIEQYMKMGNIPRVLFVPSGDSGAAFVRARVPSHVLYEAGTAVSHFTVRVDLYKAMKYDVLWIHLLAAPVLNQIARMAKEAGVKIVYDIDDRPDVIPDDNPASRLYVDNMLVSVKEMIELADVVTVSTKTLGEWATKNGAKRVVVIPNYITAAPWPNSAPRDPDIFKILWAGSPTHKADLAIAAPALEYILEKYPNVRFVCFGENIPEILMKVKDRVDLMPFVAFEDYADALASVGADLAIAPLVNNEFNRSKSAIKFLEYSACGYPTLMSPVGEYAELRALGVPAMMVADSEWKSAIENAIQMLGSGRRVDDGKFCKRWVLENRCIIKAQARPWLELVKELAASRPASEEKPVILEPV